MHPLNRRSFLQCAALAGITGLRVAAESAAPVPPARLPVFAFSKPFRQLSFADTAALCAEVGWDGLEVPVRASASHVVLERAGDDLPQLVEALRKHGKVVGQITTDIVRPDPGARSMRG